MSTVAVITGASAGRKPMIVHGARNKLAAFSVRFSPRGMVRALAASLNRPPSGR